MHDLILFHYNDSVFIRSGNSFLSTGKKQLASQFNLITGTWMTHCPINNPDFENYLGQMNLLYFISTTQHREHHF